MIFEKQTWKGHRSSPKVAFNKDLSLELLGRRAAL